MTLPGEYFWSPDIYQQETRDIFRKEWICVGRAADLPDTGSFFLYESEGETFIVVRDDQGQVNCLANVCRHRGTRLVEPSCGLVSGRISCPYHAWSYDLQGHLKNAPNMADVEAFDLGDYSLRKLPCTVWQGFVMVNLAEDCLAFSESHPTIASRFDDWELGKLVSAHRETYEVQANWKTIFQNYNECYHCSIVHPQLNPVTSVESASNDFFEGAFLGGPMVLADEWETIAMGGNFCGEPFPKLSDVDRRRVYFYTLFPTLLISPHPDYVLTHRVERRGPASTRIVCEWLFPPEVASRDGFEAARVVEFWDLTNRQDWRICELTQQGIQSSSYRPGPYSNLESVLAAFDRHYLSVLGECEAG